MHVSPSVCLSVPGNPPTHSLPGLYANTYDGIDGARRLNTPLPNHAAGHALGPPCCTHERAPRATTVCSTRREDLKRALFVATAAVRCGAVRFLHSWYCLTRRETVGSLTCATPDDVQTVQQLTTRARIESI